MLPIHMGNIFAPVHLAVINITLSLEVQDTSSEAGNQRQ